MDTNLPEVMSSKLLILSIIPFGLSIIFVGQFLHYQEEVAYSRCMAKGNSYNHCKVLVWGR